MSARTGARRAVTGAGAVSEKTAATGADTATDVAGIEPLYRLFDATVLSTERISPTFVRVTFGGGALDEFAWDGLDQRIKLMFPNLRGGYPAMRAKDPSWHAQWAALPDDTRPPMRTYTIRDRRVGSSGVEVDVDFALHEETAGPGASWASRAEAGTPLRMLGPNARARGDRGAIGWIPPAGVGRFVIAGDETALPAMACILRSLPKDARASVFAELRHPDDLVALETPAHVDVTYVARSAEPGDALSQAVCSALPVSAAPESTTPMSSGSASTDAHRSRRRGAEPDDIDLDTQILWEVPGSHPLTGGRLENDDRHAATYVWLAGEAGAIKRIRRHLVGDVGFDRQAVSFMGYWRRGRAEY